MSSPADESINVSEDSFYRSQYNGTATATETNNVSHNARSPASSKPGYVPFLDRLRALPEVRSIPWRAGQELPLDRSESSPRVQQRGAILLSTRGAVMPTACDHCAAGYGRFSLCVTFPGWFQGACSSCIFTSKGNKCSLRFETSGDTDGRALRYNSDNPDQLEPVTATAINAATATGAKKPTKPAKKRKRSSVSSLVQPAPTVYKSIYPQLESPKSASTDLDMLLQEQIAREQLLGEPDDTAQSEKPKPKSPESNVARPRGSLKTFIAQAPPHPYQSPYSMESQRIITVASTPQDTGTPNAIRQIVKERDPPTPVVATPQDQSAKTQSVRAIDTFPKAKQRQIYGLISGLQGGIDHLEKQLVSLKSLLGVEPQIDLSKVP